MATDAPKATTGQVQREIKPNKKQPITFNISGRNFKGSAIIEKGEKDEKGKLIDKIVESKTRFIPASHVALFMAGKDQKAIEKIEKKLVPLGK